MRLGFFGGSFDPPHLGHLAVAQAAAERFSLDMVLLAPTGRQPLKKAGAQASFADRLAMVHLLCDESDRLTPSAVDAPRSDGSPNYTVDTLVRVQEQAPDAAIFAIIGADSLPALPRWHGAERLFELATWIAVSRPHHPFAGMLSPVLQQEFERGRLHLIRDVNLATSSSGLRERMHHGSADLSDSLSGKVLRYIRAHHLYSGQRLARQE